MTRLAPSGEAQQQLAQVVGKDTDGPRRRPGALVARRSSVSKARDSSRL